MSLDSIVNVQISRQTRAVTQAGFGTALVFGEHNKFAEDIKTYDDIDAVGDDFATSDPEYIAALRLFGQEKSPTQIKIGKKAADAKQKVNVAVTTVVDDTLYTTTVNGTAYEYTSDADATAAEISAGLKAAIDLGGEPVTVTDNAGDFDIEADVAGVPFTYVVDTNLTATETTENVNYASELERVSEVDNDWYALVTISHTDADIKYTAEWIEARRKIYLTSSDSADILTTSTTDIASYLEGKNYARTAIVYSADAAAYPEAAWLGLNLPEDPGSITWKFKEVSGITADNLTSTQKTNASGKNCNTYTEIGGVDIFEEGIVVSGEFIDVIRGVDWIQARIQENVFNLLVNSPKVPYTNDGIQTVANQIDEILKQAVDRTILSEYSIDTPLVSEIPQATRTTRLLPDIEFDGILAGAVHATNINGVVSV
jgi:hypothetical protein